MDVSRDHRKLRVFQQADGLALRAYALTTQLPGEEKYGLQAQIRRGAVSVVTNIVEGSARATAAEYRRFLDIAHASAREVAYLLDLAARLGFIAPTDADSTVNDYNALSAGLIKLTTNLPDP